MEDKKAATVFGGHALAQLHRLRRVRATQERCELCAASVEEQHKHFVESASHRVICVCDMCTILLDGKGAQRYRRVSSEIRRLSGFRLTDYQWQSLRIPVSLVFFYTTDDGSAIFSVFPSPGGPVKSEVDEGAWKDLVRENPALNSMRPYIDALLVNRMKNAADYFLVPIDECYRLAGAIRRHWHGMSGGDEVDEHVAACLREWRERAVD